MSLGQRGIRVKKSDKYTDATKGAPDAIEQGQWLEQNRQALGLAFEWIDVLLQQNFGGENRHVEPSPEAALRKLRSHVEAMALPPAYEVVAYVFKLSEFEKFLVLLAAAAEIDSNVQQTLYQAGQKKITFSLAFQLFDGAHWNATGPQSALRYWRILSLDKNDFVSQAALRLDERVMHALLGVAAPDERLMPYIYSYDAHVNLSKSQCDTVGTIPVSIAHVNFHGANQKDKVALAKVAAKQRSERLYCMNISSLPKSVADRHLFAILWQREAMLTQASLYIDAHEVEHGAVLHDLKEILNHINGRVYIGSHEPLPGFVSAFRLEISKPLRKEQNDLWLKSLSHNAGKMMAEISNVSDDFDFGAGDIDEVCTIYNASNDEALNTICKKQSRPSLDSLAQNINVCAVWDDLILPESKKRILMDVERHVKQRNIVLNDWGFDRISARGLGLSVLLSGPSGTGKTLTAEILANALDLDLYKVDLSSTVSKYIGETEKNLRRIFDAAENGGSMLLFDEADALFGKRTEAESSHDRHANIEVSYLLQRMEQYRGVVILTTNFKSAIDKAFMRRINYCVQFPFPDFEQRKAVWANIFPQDAKTKDLDFDKLASLSIAPGHIRNMALYASFVAADEGCSVGMKHLLYAAQAEYMKLEKTLSPKEVQGWV
ncbi:MAG: ATP-binding protein [Alphaproteobacteria bacterium]